MQHFDLPAAARGYSAVVYFPLQLDDDSGVAHVLEHMVGMTRTAHGSSFYALPQQFPELKVNAITDAEHLAFYFTCRTRASFEHALATLLDAALVQELDAALFRQECFHWQGDSAGGVVYNEMKGVYYTRSRQLAKATSNLLFPGQPLAYEPGGDPECVRRLRLPQLAAFRRRFLRPENCIVVTRGPDACRALPALPAGASPQAEPATRRLRSREGQHYIAGSDAAAPTYRRLLFPLGHLSDTRIRCLSWAVEIVYEQFLPLFQAVCARHAAPLAAQFSGVQAIGPQLYLALTLESAASDDSALPGRLAALVRQVFGAQAQALDINQALEAKEMDLREVMSSNNSHTPTDLLQFIRFERDGRAPAFDSLEQDLAHCLERYADRATLFGELSELFQDNDPHVLELAPAGRRRQDIEAHERRLAARLVRAGAAAASATPARSGPGAAPLPIVTNGVTYCHQLYNLTSLAGTELRYVPLLLRCLEARATELGLPAFSGFLFAYAVGNDQHILVAACKARRLARRRWQADDFAQALGQVLLSLSGSLTLDDALVHALKAQLLQSPLALGLQQCSASAAAAAAASRLWSGAPQLAFLDHVLQVPAERANHVAALRQLAGQLIKLPQLVFAIDDQAGQEQLRAGMQAAMHRQDWLAGASRQALAPAPAPLQLVSGSGYEPVIIMKMALDPGRLAQYAAVCALADAINERYLAPILRDRDGAYGAYMAVDLAQDQLYIVVHRTPAILTQLAALQPGALQACLAQVSAADFERYRKNCLHRLAGNDCALNLAILSLYNLATLAQDKLDRLRLQLAGLDCQQALASAASYLLQACASYFVAADLAPGELDALRARGFHPLAMDAADHLEHFAHD